MTTREEILETVRRRRKRVIGLLISLKGHELSVADVAERLNISTTLAKLDLDELAKRGKLIRFRRDRSVFYTYDPDHAEPEYTGDISNWIECYIINGGTPE